MVRILHDDWSVRLGENRCDQCCEIFGNYATSYVQMGAINDVMFSNVRLE